MLDTTYFLAADETDSQTGAIMLAGLASRVDWLVARQLAGVDKGFMRRLLDANLAWAQGRCDEVTSIAEVRPEEIQNVAEGSSDALAIRELNLLRAKAFYYVGKPAAAMDVLRLPWKRPRQIGGFAASVRLVFMRDALAIAEAAGTHDERMEARESVGRIYILLAREGEVSPLGSPVPSASMPTSQSTQH
jgi:hypothetical protein